MSYAPNTIVANIASLLSATINTLPSTPIYVEGYSTVADGGEGEFTVGASTTANGVTIINDASGRSWYRNTGANPISVKWAGATGNGTTDDTIAVQLAENTAGSVTGGIYYPHGVYFPPGTYLINNTGIAKANGVTWAGSGMAISVIKAANQTWANSLVSGGAISNCSFFRLGFDFTNATITGLPSLLAMTTFTNGEIANCAFTGIKAIGIQIGGGTNFSVHDNFISSPSAISTLAEGIWITDNTSIPSHYSIKNNILNYIGTDFNGTDATISGNIITQWIYGSGITVEQGATRFVISDNICNFGAGIDSNSVYSTGIENWASYATITGNYCYGNWGGGIFSGGSASTVSGNSCINNGAGMSSNPLYRVGIQSRYVSSTYNSSNSVVIGNICVDTGSGTQLYGYGDDGASVTRITLSDNNLIGATSPMNATGTEYSFRGPRLTYTGTGLSGFTAGSLSQGGGGVVGVSGAAIGDSVSLSINTNLSGLIPVAWVSSAGSVSFTFFNPGGGSVTIPAYSVFFAVEKPFNYANY